MEAIPLQEFDDDDDDDDDDVVCYRCGRAGHIRPECYAKTHVKGYRF